MSRSKHVQFFRWAWPLFALITTTLAIQKAFNHMDVSPADSWLLLTIGAAYLMAVIYMVVLVRRWTFRSLGQVAAYMADTLLYIRLGGASRGWFGSMSDDAANRIRALFIEGAFLLVVGLNYWAWQEDRGHVRTRYYRVRGKICQCGLRITSSARRVVRRRKRST